MAEKEPNVKKVQNKLLNEKQKTVQNKSNLIKQVCPHCGIMISRNLTVHIRRVHLKEKNFSCDLCE